MTLFLVENATETPLATGRINRPETCHCGSEKQFGFQMGTNKPNVMFRIDYLSIFLLFYGCSGKAANETALRPKKGPLWETEVLYIELNCLQHM